MDINEIIPLNCHLYRCEYYKGFNSEKSDIMYICAKSIESALKKLKDLIKNSQMKIVDIKLIVDEVFLRAYNDEKV